MVSTKGLAPLCHVKTMQHVRMRVQTIFAFVHQALQASNVIKMFDHALLVILAKITEIANMSRVIMNVNVKLGLKESTVQKMSDPVKLITPVKIKANA